MKKKAEESSVSSTVVYPESHRRTGAGSVSTSIPASIPMKSPAPFLWDSDVEADEPVGEPTAALPFHDPDETASQGRTSSHDRTEESDLEAGELILEDVTIPVEENLLVPDSRPAEKTTPKAVPATAPTTDPTVPAAVPIENLLPESEEITVPEEAAVSSSVKAGSSRGPKFSPLLSVHKSTLLNSTHEAKSQDEEPSVLESDSEEESIDLILEPVPEESESREKSILETTGYFQDAQVLQAAFFTKEGAVQYPVRSGSGIWPIEKTAEKKKDEKVSNEKSVSSPMMNTSQRVSSPETQIEPETPSEINDPVARSLRRQPTKPRGYPVSTPHREPVQESVVSEKTVPNRSSSEASPRSEAPAAEQTTAPDSNPESLVYNPPFPELDAPVHRIRMSLPVRNVFRDFGIRKEVDKSSLPWYANYIRELDVNEEHLFNSLRVLGNTKLSKSRCQFSLMEASIIASQPHSAQEANRLLNIYENIESSILQKLKVVDEQAQLSAKQKEELKAELILDFMHQNVFVKYVLEGTTITNLLDHGYYNCVTASLLYCSLAERAGLNVTAVELPGHAMCWIYLADGERLEVETTCSNWFKYRNDPETQQKVICKLIRDASPQLKEQSDKMLLLQIPQPISDKRLIAKIYYNRGVDLLSSSDYAGALEANVIAYCLDPQSKTTLGNLLATMNNWAIALCREGKYKEATALLRTGLHYQPDYPPFRNNHTHVYHHWVDSLYRSGHLNEALQVATLAASEQPDVEHFKRLQTQIQQSIATLNQANTVTK